jgi:hypothetical protein
MGFRMVYSVSHLAGKKFWSIFRIRWDLSQKNAKKNYWFKIELSELLKSNGSIISTLLKLTH